MITFGMATVPLVKRLNKEIMRLKEEIGVLRSFVISVAGQDKEGDYRPEFVRRVMKSVKERPVFQFRGANSFLEQLHNV